ncbi:P-loop containing nucleoside triphosphate hydrolase protein [Phycomyces blakesleeanus]|uniref:P-loop containing nucleoside triphosphate hydrolase protein n=1 Tax=Phycomyces blakesleeanus TaxID=4837 RepID=A0ABR3AYE4_PHYBL
MESDTDDTADVFQSNNPTAPVIPPSHISRIFSRLKRKKKKKKPAVPVYKLFSFASPLDIFLICIACICSAGIGAIQPASIIFFGSFVSNLTEQLSNPTDLLNATMPMILTYVYIGTASLVAAYIARACWIFTGENQTRRIRQKYMHSILRQDMSWFDKAGDGSLTTRLASDTQLIQDGISERFGDLITGFAQFVSGIVIAFSKGWQLAVIILAILPLMLGSVIVLGYYTTKLTLDAQASYADAGTVAEQVFAGIRTVYAFSLQKRFSERYDVELDKAKHAGVNRGKVVGFFFGLFVFILFCSYGLSLWYGSQLVVRGTLQGSTVLVVFFSMMMGSMALIQLPTSLVSISSASGAAYSIFETIHRVPSIDTDQSDGLAPDSIVGKVEFRHVLFHYPTRPNQTILRDLSLTIRPGMTVAFVGPSGSGKSTSVQLLQRFYDPVDGQILLDGNDIREYNPMWLRQNIGVVSQEPVLFNMSIRQNLIMGTYKQVTDQELKEACIKANCHSFITQLSQGYETLVGEQGGMLSGGQKQRIAIARAILKNPTILLLDEATSALDTQSERLVQHALDAVSKDRTTIVIAHRLSTIRNSDLIVVMDHGELAEQGTHEELLDKGGIYADLVSKQAIATERVDQHHHPSALEKEIEDPNELLYQEKKEVHQQQEQYKQQQQDSAFQVTIQKGTSISPTATVVQAENKDGYAPISDQHKEIDAYELKLKKMADKKKQMKKQRAPMLKVVRQMRPEWPLLGVGLLCSAISGATSPCYALAFSKVITLITSPNNVAAIAPGPFQGANLFAFFFFIIGIGAFVGHGGQLAIFNLAGERYTKRLRSEIFRAYMKQEIGFFDQSDNTVGALTSKLSIDAKNVNEMVTMVWGDVTQLIVTAIVGLIIAFSNSWLLTLIILCMAPFIISATNYESLIHRGFEDKTKRANQESGEVAGEAIKEIRTVVSLNRQKYFEDKYYKATERPHRLAMRKAYLSSIGYALLQGIMIYTNAVAFYAGVRLIMGKYIDFNQMFISMTAIMITARSVGRGSVFASTYAKAKYSAIASFEIIERHPTIDPDLEGIEPSQSTIRGDVGFENVGFSYPTRPDHQIFSGEFNMDTLAGQTVALVGPSGCGKSTTIGLLERWYDPFCGKVSLDDKDVRTFELHNLRSHMALVGQEPVLFDYSIGDNIRFGVCDDDSSSGNNNNGGGNIPSQADVEAAAKGSNIHDFINGLPDGYATRVGDKGSQLSGGQKQRIAIARALMRQPRLLLLDEATSALDSDSEKVVQEAIDAILVQGGRTTITIAHRLSTIQNAHLICVVKDGRVVEQGTHWDLLDLGGVYSQLVREQSLQAH